MRPVLLLLPLCSLFFFHFSLSFLFDAAFLSLLLCQFPKLACLADVVVTRWMILSPPFVRANS